MKKALITGFDPFNNESINPSMEAVKLLPDTIDGSMIIKEEIPTVFKESISRVIDLIESEGPDIVICVGQAGGRDCITPERIAINQDDARIPDNKGNQPIDETINSNGENAYFSTLPIKAIVRDINEADIPAKVSNTAGTFVCNHLMYGVLDYIDRNNLNIRAGFIHVPFIPIQTKGEELPSLELDEISNALKIAIQSTIDNKVDIKKIGGEIS